MTKLNFLHYSVFKLPTYVDHTHTQHRPICRTISSGSGNAKTGISSKNSEKLNDRFTFLSINGTLYTQSGVKTVTSKMLESSILEPSLGDGTIMHNNPLAAMPYPNHNNFRFSLIMTVSSPTFGNIQLGCGGISFFLSFLF